MTRPGLEPRSPGPLVKTKTKCHIFPLILFIFFISELADWCSAEAYNHLEGKHINEHLSFI